MKKKGDPKTGGRKKHTPNRVTCETRIWVQGLIDQNRETLEADLKALEPMQKWQVVEKLLSYCVPKLAAQTIEVDLQNLSDEQLEQIINSININDNE